MDLSSKTSGDEWALPNPERAGADISSSLKHGNPQPKNGSSCGPRIIVESERIAWAPDSFITTTDLHSKVSCGILKSYFINPICKRQLARLNSLIEVNDKNARRIDRVEEFYK